MAAIQLARQAFITFRTQGSPTFSSNLERLKNLLDNLTAEDINLTIPNDQTEGVIKSREAPVSHIGIYECPFFSMGVFIIKKGCEIPLHDHPSMYGLCKVLYGKIKVKSYSLYNNGPNKTMNGGVHQRRAIQCQMMNDILFDPKAGSCVLTPKVGNYHSIQAIPGPTAFLDILAPPYAPDQERDCTYYKECDQSPNRYNLDDTAEENDRVRWLIPVNAPREFYCDSQVAIAALSNGPAKNDSTNGKGMQKVYTGPEIIL